MFGLEASIPSRRTRHPSQKGKWTKVFLRTLLFLFVLLIVGLIVWYKKNPIT